MKGQHPNFPQLSKINFLGSRPQPTTAHPLHILDIIIHNPVTPRIVYSHDGFCPSYSKQFHPVYVHFFGFDPEFTYPNFADRYPSIQLPTTSIHAQTPPSTHLPCRIVGTYLSPPRHRTVLRSSIYTHFNITNPHKHHNHGDERSRSVWSYNHRHHIKLVDKQQQPA